MMIRILVGFIFTIALLISSCESSKLNPSLSLNGTWESLGSGILLEIKDSSNYTFYDITSISCLPSREGAFKELQEALKFNNDTLSLLQGVITHEFIKVARLPERCTQILKEEKAKDPLYNFDVFSETVKEHYAFLELNNIKWNELYDRQRGKLNEQSTDAELYLVIEETLEKLNDNHAFLEATDEVHDSVDELSGENERGIDLRDANLREYGDFEVAAMVAKHHMVEDMTEDSWLIHWGKMSDDIGYVQVNAMWLHGDLDLPEQLVDEVGHVDAYVETFHKMYEGDYVNKEIEGVRRTMDKVMKDISDMESIVIDVRFNGGGQDAVSFEILSRFASERIQVATQKLRYGDQHTTVTPLYVDGRNDAYVKDVFILTSPKTGSAAEAFSLSSMVMGNAKRIGSATQGALSTALEKTLPNGWSFAISNEVYMDNEENNFENIGVPVDYELNYPRDIQAFFRSVVGDLERDRADILGALRLLRTL